MKEKLSPYLISALLLMTPGIPSVRAETGPGGRLAAKSDEASVEKNKKDKKEEKKEKKDKEAAPRPHAIDDNAKSRPPVSGEIPPKRKPPKHKPAAKPESTRADRPPA